MSFSTSFSVLHVVVIRSVIEIHGKTTVSSVKSLKVKRTVSEIIQDPFTGSC